MRDKMRKAYQREFNKRIRALNKNIANDNLWRGRFIFLQRDARWWRFSDGSGGELIVFVRGYDKKTGYYKDYRLEFAPWLKSVNWHLSMDIANEFITEAAEVWTENPRPSIDTAEDWTSAKVNVEKLMAKDWNFHVAYKYWEGGKNVW